MNINDAACTGGEAGLHERVVFREVRLIDRAGRGVVRKELPAYGKTEDVEAIVVDKVLHLTGAIRAVVLGEWGPCRACSAVAVGVATEIETRDVDTGELQLSCTGRGSTRRSRSAARTSGGGRGAASRGNSSRSGSRDALRII